MSLITPIEAETYITNWESYVLNHKKSDLNHLFKVNGKSFYGFSIPFNNFKPLLGRIGVKFFKVRFALNSNTNPDYFRLVIWGVDENGTIATDYFYTDSPKEVYNEPFSNTLFMGTQIPSANSFDKIPTALASEWLVDWEDLNTINKSLFETQDQILRGYTFNYIDFIAIFNRIKITSGNKRGIENFNVCLAFVNHNYDSHNEKSGDLGLLVLTLKNDIITNQINMTEETSLYFDLSAPCPSTC